MTDPQSVLAQLMATIEDRKANPSTKSYTTTLMAGGVQRMGAKITEEAAEVVDAAGTVLGSRPLAHPHETEQPFTRATTVQVPSGVAQVFVRTRCNVDGWHEGLFAVTLPE